jgi:putative transposase
VARIARIVVPGVAHHITQRGIRRSNVFLDDSDRCAYLGLFLNNSRRFSLRVLAYCLMSNHVHFVAVPGKENSIWKTFHRTHCLYAMGFNGKYGLTGHLWQGRPYSCVLDETHQWAAVRYVELNPVRAGIISRAEDYQWSSARAHCGTYEDPLVDHDWPPAGLIQNWPDWLYGGDSTEINQQIRDRTFTGRPCGNDDFLRVVGYTLNRDLVKKKPGPKLGRIEK